VASRAEFGLDGPETLLHLFGGKDSGFSYAGTSSLGWFLFEAFGVSPFRLFAASAAFLHASLDVGFDLRLALAQLFLRLVHSLGAVIETLRIGR
jgi:hypothetical protein